jgi:D-glycero-D-manno-heptose 1,7-bisphosphate phosphatase
LPHKHPAVFLDRDGVINDLVYFSRTGTVGSPLRAKDLRVFPYSSETILSLQQLGFKVILISNQPGVAKRQFSHREFEAMKRKVSRQLLPAKLDAEYYCLHHPHAVLSKYRKDCNCRKPKPGLFFKAAKEMSLDLSKSYYIGDSLEDVRAGAAAGVKTVLIAHVTDFLNRMIREHRSEPDFVIQNLKAAPQLIESFSRKKRSRS